MRLRDAVLGFLASMQLATCADVSPVSFVARDAGKDAAVAVDAAEAIEGGGDDAAAGSLVQECRVCLDTGACSEASHSCAANAKCDAYAKCMTDVGCWRERLVDFSKPPLCYVDCATKSGITNQVDDALSLFIGVLGCAQDAAGCASSCAPGRIE